MFACSKPISTKEDLIEVLERFGFLPLFANSIPGFSVEEHVDPAVWFTDQEGVWEWKGPVIRQSGCAYGKLLEKKAVFVSRAWYPDLANLRRDGYDFDARFDDGLASRREQGLYDRIEHAGPIRSKELKKLGNYGPKGNKGFDGLITRLQLLGYVVISDFVYDLDRYGRPYGWGRAEYATAEQRFGPDFAETVYCRSPEASMQRLLDHFCTLFPQEDPKKLARILRG